MPDATPHIIVTLNGVEHPIHMDEITARQIMLVRDAFGMAPRIFPRLVAAEVANRDAGKPENSVLDLPEIAALVYLSKLQTEGNAVDFEPILDGLTTGTEVKVTMPRPPEPAEVPDLDPPA